MKELRIISQVLVVLLLGSISAVLLWSKIPGNDEVCDAGQGYYIIIWGFFYISCILFIINSWIFYEKGDWKKFRLNAIKITFLIIFLSFFLKGILLTTLYGIKKHTIVEKPGNGVFTCLKLKLYNSGKFFCYTYDASCEQETFGTYTLENNLLKLKFESKLSDYLGTELKIIDKSITCLNCSYDINLIIVN